jgi:group I intron endonuclease
MKIYVVTNKINGKQYVGQTVRDLGDRLKRHFNDAEKGDNLYFHRAILKYGKENFLS